MMLTLTYLANLVEMGVSLWLAFFLVVRGYPNLTTIRIAVNLLALSAYFLAAFNNHFNPVAGSAALRAILLVISMGFWYCAIFSLLANEQINACAGSRFWSTFFRSSRPYCFS